MSLDYKLRFLTGSVAGRELLLPAGELRLGSDDPDIDVPLANGGNAILHLSDDGVVIDAGPPVWVDGVPRETESPVPFGKVIDIDGTALVFGRAGDQLPMRPVPAHQDAGGRRSGNVAKRAGLVALVALPLAILAVALIDNSGGAASASPRQQPLKLNSESDDAWVKGLISELGLSGLTFRRDESGTLVIAGTCTESEKLQALHARLKQRSLRTREDLICDDQLRRQIDAVLGMNGYSGTEIRLGPASGSVQLRGEFKADAQWESTERQLRRLAYVTTLTVTNDDAESFQALLTQLRQGNLLTGLSVRVTEQRIAVSGQLPASRQNEVQRVLRAFNQQSGSRLQAAFENIPLARPLGSILPAPIESLSGDSDAPLLRLTNGMSLAEGAILPGGFTIFSLSSDGITVLRNLELLYLPLGFANS